MGTNSIAETTRRKVLQQLDEFSLALGEFRKAVSSPQAELVQLVGCLECMTGGVEDVKKTLTTPERLNRCTGCGARIEHEGRCRWCKND